MKTRAIVRSQRGFTLMEVLIALAILAISVTMLLSVNSASMGYAATSRDVTVATLLARSKMIDIELEQLSEGFTVDESEDEGDFGDEGHPEIKWKSKVSEIEMTMESLVNLCEGFMGSAEDEGLEPDAGCQEMVGTFGIGIDPLMQMVSESMRLVELEVWWSVGGKYKETMRVSGLITKDK